MAPMGECDSHPAGAQRGWNDSDAGRYDNDAPGRPLWCDASETKALADSRIRLLNLLPLRAAVTAT
jgi:hypothetical protein